MAIAQGILTNFDANLEILAGQTFFGTFGGDTYSLVSSWGVPIAIETTIRMLGFVTSVSPFDSADIVRMRIYNRTQNTSATANFSNWNLYTLNSLALSTPLDVAQGDLVYLSVGLISSNLANVNVQQVLATYDLVTTI